MTENKELQSIILGAGCFWGVEEAFDALNGIVHNEVGYSGGHSKNPSYKEVCSGETGHAEVVRLQYDPGIIGLEEILNTFWKIHDPTSINRQGPDIGSQYRSAVFYFNDEQKKIIEKSIEKLEKSGSFNKPVVSEVNKADAFYRAEEYHQKYYQKNGIKGCSI